MFYLEGAGVEDCSFAVGLCVGFEGTKLII